MKGIRKKPKHNYRIRGINRRYRNTLKYYGGIDV
jgi:hypothetical protein